MVLIKLQFIISGGKCNITKGSSIQSSPFLISISCDYNSYQVILNLKKVTISKALINEQPVYSCQKRQGQYLKVQIQKGRDYFELDVGTELIISFSIQVLPLATSSRVKCTYTSAGFPYAFQFISDFSREERARVHIQSLVK